jgi:hypothetical protein
VQRFGSELVAGSAGPIGSRAVGQQLAVDFLDADFVPLAAERGGIARALFGPDALRHGGLGQRAEQVARRMAVAPQQRVEAIERQELDPVAAIERARQRVRKNGVGQCSFPGNAPASGGRMILIGRARTGTAESS